MRGGHRTAPSSTMGLLETAGLGCSVCPAELLLERFLAWTELCRLHRCHLTCKGDALMGRSADLPDVLQNWELRALLEFMLSTLAPGNLFIRQEVCRSDLCHLMTTDSC